MTDQNEKTTAISPVDDFIQEELPLLLHDAEVARQRAEENMDWLPEWFMGKLAELDAAEKLIKEQSQVLLRQVATRRKALQWRYGREFQAAVNKQLQGTKKKSVDFFHGRAGYLATPERTKLVVDDELVAAMHLNKTGHEDMVGVKVDKAALNKLFKAEGEEIPGTHLETTERVERFYPACGAPDLVGEQAPLLEGDPNVSEGNEDNL